MNSIARFNARVARTWNAQVWPEMAHLEQQNAYIFPKPTRAKKEKPAVTTYKTTLTTLARETPEQAEAKRQQAILATRLANLEKARAVKAAKRSATTAKETAPVNEIDALRAQIAALTAQIERLASPAAPAPVAPAPVASKPAKPAKAPYVKTALKMVDYGKGRRALQIDATLVVVAWNGKTWDYACGTRKGTAADRGEAFAKVNVLLANAGLPPVRA